MDLYRRPQQPQPRLPLRHRLGGRPRLRSPHPQKIPGLGHGRMKTIFLSPIHYPLSAIHRSAIHYSAIFYFHSHRQFPARQRLGLRQSPAAFASAYSGFIPPVFPTAPLFTILLFSISPATRCPVIRSSRLRRIPKGLHHARAAEPLKVLGRSGTCGCRYQRSLFSCCGTAARLRRRSLWRARKNWAGKRRRGR